MPFDFGTAVTLGGMAVAGIVWLVRLEGRHNVADTKFTAMEKRIDGLEEKILARLERIEEILLSGKHG